jgi:hypothetical protein
MEQIKSTLPKKYVFKESLAENVKYEEALDVFFGQMYHITKTDRLLDLCGVDRIFEHKRTGHKLAVEYKTDHIGHKTHNFFVETIVGESRGWFFTSLSQCLVVFFPELEKAIRLDFLQLKREILERGKKENFPTKECHNEKYKSIGQLVPISFLESIGKVFVVKMPLKPDPSAK